MYFVCIHKNSTESITIPLTELIWTPVAVTHGPLMRIHWWEIVTVPMQALPSLLTVIYGWQPPRKHIDTIGCNGSDGAFMWYRASDPQTMSLPGGSQLPSPKAFPHAFRACPGSFRSSGMSACALRLLKLASKGISITLMSHCKANEKMKNSYRWKVSPICNDVGVDVLAYQV